MGALCHNVSRLVYLLSRKKERKDDNVVQYFLFCLLYCTFFADVMVIWSLSDGYPAVGV